MTQNALAAAILGALAEDRNWLAQRLPDYDLDRVQMPLVEIMTEADFGGRANALQRGRHERIQAIYDPARNAIGVSDEFNELTPGLRALMLHEYTHAVQAAHDNRTPDREHEAYRVQQDWRRAQGLPYGFPEDIRRTLDETDRRLGIERSPAQRGIYRDGRITGFPPQEPR